MVHWHWQYVDAEVDLDGVCRRSVVTSVCTLTYPFHNVFAVLVVRCEGLLGTSGCRTMARKLLFIFTRTGMLLTMSCQCNYGMPVYDPLPRDVKSSPRLSPNTHFDSECKHHPTASIAAILLMPITGTATCMIRASGTGSDIRFLSQSLCASGSGIYWICCWRYIDWFSVREALFNVHVQRCGFVRLARQENGGRSRRCY